MAESSAPSSSLQGVTEVTPRKVSVPIIKEKVSQSSNYKENDSHS